MTACVLMACLFAGCYAPSPLYGTWTDNQGNVLKFISDGTFTMSIASNSVNRPESYSGTYTVLDNVLIFTTDKGAVRTTEWDVRASILYLEWVDTTGTTLQITLYHSAR